MSALLLDLILPLSSESDSNGILVLLAAGPVGGVLMYWGVYVRYRNTGRSHGYEHETLVEAQPVSGNEQKVDHISKTRESSIKGSNRGNHRERVKRR